ncbi:hypothetical protein UY3_12806 [Chelonia mydas]|uniref:Uncharacterized protein n=1 Tax=Chelonia mydas TaxID=8469 RepID=M7B3N3_CHEMY|nr:hypothetical protein UY3_12806 [Chelonia mydas]
MEFLDVLCQAESQDLNLGLLATIQLDVNVMEEQAERITGETMVVRARQTILSILNCGNQTFQLNEVGYLGHIYTTRIGG